MVETGKEYVLQWSGHAARITERFSGLLARQALVDVTLLCQEQKLRVHKLVLASCSLYFEEILEQDLGQEPIILLNDLDFDILKAMVEFMYCGETTIAHYHLRSLLNAAQVFQVKDLELILDGMSDIQSIVKNDIRKESLENEESGEMCDTITANKDCIQVKLSGKELCETSELFDDSTLRTKQIIDYSSINDGDERKNYSYDIIDSTNAIAATEKNSDDDKNDCRSNLIEENSDDYEIDDNSDYLDVPRNVGECYKVYSHKKRKTMERKKSPLLRVCEKMPDKLTTTHCIDLSNDDSNCDITPVTLPLTLEMETTDYIWSLSALTSDRHSSLYDGNFENSGFYYPNCIRQMKELFSIDNRNIPIRTPVLRRSMRLNQLENDDSVNNNNTNNNNNSDSNITRRDTSKDFNLKSIKMKRKIKESDENNISQRKNVHSRALRSTTKLASKTNGRCSFSRIAKDDTKSKSGKLKDDKLGKTESLDTEAFVPMKLNTIASVNRSLWGDMSDVIENRENGQINSSEYSSSKDIPFAVGLLPLRAALERMQAIPDYQPRKTRSSVAPMKHDLNGFKKKSITNDLESISVPKCSRVCSVNDTSSSDCNIENHTSSQCIQIYDNLTLADPLVSDNSISVKR